MNKDELKKLEISFVEIFAIVVLVGTIAYLIIRR